MLHVSTVSKAFADATLFQEVSFDINAGDRLGLVGPNGCGKTTLLRILTGELPPDQGSVRLMIPRSQIGYLPQSLIFADDTTVQQVLAGSRARDEQYWAGQVEALARQMATAQGPALDQLQEAYADALDQLTYAAKVLPQHDIERVLAGLDMGHVSPETPVQILSGGQKTRLGLARLLVQNPSLLLLDEPTNHLDITALEWLEGYLSAYQGAMLIVSHDRTFLDHTITRVLEVGVEKLTVTAYEGNYSAYLDAKQREREKHALAYKNQQERVQRLQSAIRGIEAQARSIEQETIDFHYRKQALKIARRAVTHKARLERMLASEDHLEKPQQHWEIKLAFVDTPHSGQDVLILDNLGKRFGSVVLFKHVNLVLRRQERVALVGPNGSGKTTLLRMIVGQQAPSSGQVRIGANVKIGYFSQEQENLDGSLTPFEIVRRHAALSETDARRFLHLFLFAGDEVFVPAGQLSYGERARLALGVLVLQGCNLLLLDEPINHLDIPSREQFEQALQGYKGTILSVAHDRYFVERYATSIWAMVDGTIRRFADLDDVRRKAGLLAARNQM